MREDITFESNGNRLLGYLFLPEDLAAGQKVPAVVSVGPASSTKGQVPTIYAERLQALGYAALAFDHGSYGESAPPAATRTRSRRSRT